MSRFTVTSPLIESYKPGGLERQEAAALHVLDMTKTRTGLTLLMEALLFLVAAVTIGFCVMVACLHGSVTHGYVAALLFLLTCWPFIRAELLR